MVKRGTKFKKFLINRKISERLSAEQVIHSVFLDEDSDFSGGDSSDDGADRVYIQCSTTF